MDTFVLGLHVLLAAILVGPQESGKSTLAAAKPYATWLANSQFVLEDLPEGAAFTPPPRRSVPGPVQS